jgi:hypothetical protein
MHVSLNEIDAQVRRAARGAGLSWGQAEEAGKAVRKLVGQGFEVLAAFADLLESHATGSGGASTIDNRNGTWRGTDGPLSPLVLGPAISDHAEVIGSGRMITAGPVRHPILLIPFVMTVARICEKPVEIQWPNGHAVVWPDGANDVDIDCLSRLSTVPEVVFRLTDGRRVRHLIASSWTGACVTPDLWNRFDRLAHLTYVPASDHSRRSGAGAGAIDND